MKNIKIILIFFLFLTINVKHIYPQAGQLDTIFGQGGAINTEINFVRQSSYPASIAIQNDGKIVIAGYTDAGPVNDLNFAVARYNKNGSLDNTFGINGKVITPIGSKNDAATSLAIQSDGKIVAAGYSFNSDNKKIIVVRYYSDGNLDKSFGVNGILTTSFNNFSSSASSIVVQNDGKILVGGSVQINNDYDFALARYNSEGSFDNTFGTSGIITAPTGGSKDLLNSIIIQKDGKIVAVGKSLFLDNNDFMVARYNSNGSLDNSFGIDGKITTSMGPNDVPTTVSIQSNGKIIAAGFSSIGGQFDFALVRYNGDGSLDNAFGTSGRVTTPIGITGSTIYSVKSQNDGGIEAIGFSTNTLICDLDVVHYNSDGSLDSTFGVNGIMTMPTEYDARVVPPTFSSAVKQDDESIITVDNIFDGINNNIFLYRFTKNGSLDKTFGASGGTATKFGVSKNYCCSAVIQSDQTGEKIVTAGHSWNGNNFEFALSRFNSDGSLDSFFGINGIITTLVGNSDAFANSSALQSDGKIIVTGSSSDGSKKVFTTARFNADGSLDNTFGTSGIVTTSIGNLDSYANAVTVQKDGKIITAGVSPSSFGIGITNHVFTLIRYNPNGTLDSDFGTNGIVTKRINTFYSEATSLEIQEDGKILAGGFSGVGGKVFSLVRLNPDGKSDTTFSDDGITSTAVGKIEGQVLNSSISEIKSIAMQNDGKIIACGYCTNGKNGGVIAKDFALVRYNSDGSVDSTFGTGGIIITSIGNLDDIAYSVKIQDDGKIIAGGYTDSGNDEDYAIARYNSNGCLDSTFGTNGITVNNFGASGNFIKSILVQSDGNIIAAGYSANEDSSEVVNIITRYLGNNRTTDIFENGIKKLPASFNLYQNYPNPFNPSTTIKYSIPNVASNFSLSNVTLIVYDVLGRKIATLVNEEKAAGNYKVTFDASNLASGIYFFKLDVNNLHQVKKMILLK